MAAAVLDGMASDWTEERLTGLLQSEFGEPSPLDGFVRMRGRNAMAVGPALSVQIVSGSVPGVGVNAIVRSLMVKGPTLLKPGRGDVVLPVLFARALREVDPALADALAVVYWPGGDPALEAAALSRADVVTAYGSDETVRELRSRVRVTARFVAYHHRVSIGVVGREALTGTEVERTASEVAAAIGFFDQRGCVSPQVIYVEEGGPRSPRAFAGMLASALGELETRLPGGTLDLEEAAALHQARGTAELMAAAGPTEVIHGGDASWTVVFEAEPGPIAACVGRVVRVRPLADAEGLPGLLEPLGEHLQTVGVAGLGDRLEGLARAMGVVGASRVAPFSSVPFPPPWWHHDGRGPLVDLVRWVDLEERATLLWVAALPSR